MYSACTDIWTCDSQLSPNFVQSSCQSYAYKAWWKYTGVEMTNRKYLCFPHFKAPCWHKSHNRRLNNYSYTCIRIVVFAPKITHDAKRYLDTHYTSVTRTRQAWTYFLFLQYNVNKGIHYSPGILRRSIGLILPEAAPKGDISTPWLITPAHQASALNLLLNNEHDLSCHRESPERKFSVKTEHVKADKGDKPNLCR